MFSSAFLLGLVGTTAAATVSIPAGDSRVAWAGRHRVNSDTSVSFDWLGVTARVSCTRCSYLAVTTTTTATTRGTRLKAYVANQGFQLYPQVQFWVPVPGKSPVGNTSLLWMGSGSADVTLENLVDAQYGTGITTVASFECDGTFVAAPPLAPSIPDAGAAAAAAVSAHTRWTAPTAPRRIEIIGDSITAATNVVRPEGAGSCGDGGYQSDWSQTYEALLCHRFGAECSTIAVGGKCVMRECGGLQMPDYFTGAFYADGSKPTYDFAGPWKPDAMVIDLGTNDMRAITKIGFNATTGTGAGMTQFTRETVSFMKNATVLYGKPDIQFFLTAGPMENTTYTGTSEAVAQGKAVGLKVTLIDMRSACASARLHANTDLCDGCAGHPGIEGHRGMYEAAWPVIKATMGW